MGNGEWEKRILACPNSATLLQRPTTRLYDSLFPILDFREGRQAFSAIFLAFSTASSMPPTM